MKAQEIEKDLSFLKEMRELTQSLINDRFDITLVQDLDKRIEDWIYELENKQPEG